MSKFGWDLPPGCTMNDIERAAGGGEPSPESEKAFEILEAAEVDQDIIDKVCRIIDTLADEAYADRECPVCEKRMAEEEARFLAEHPDGQYLPLGE